MVYAKQLVKTSSKADALQASSFNPKPRTANALRPSIFTFSSSMKHEEQQTVKKPYLQVYVARCCSSKPSQSACS